ncbi:MAG: hypothetical protein NTU79_21770 [Planctomycetota bacterium]|nr:hypothetical protein [Planctomycetota bacterium]
MAYVIEQSVFTSALRRIDPNFNDADYQLAAYAVALKVLTQYGNIDGRDVEHEVFAVRARNEKSDFQVVIERALGIACDYLVPRGLAKDIGDYVKDSLAFSSGSPNSAMLPEWRNGTPIPKRHVFCSEDCGTTTPRVNLGRMCASPDSYD